MHRFRFRLERILSLRRHSEEEAERRLGRVSGEYAHLEGELGRLTEEREATFRLGDDARRADVSYRLAQDAYLSFLKQRSEAIEAERAKKAQELEKARTEYREASKRRTVLDNLKERRSAEYYREQRRAEGRELDDIGGRMSIRRREQEGDDA
ncbi:MAG: flagellar export protein FliJ [Spirochaetaceae bacterium]